MEQIQRCKPDEAYLKSPLFEMPYYSEAVAVL